MLCGERGTHCTNTTPRTLRTEAPRHARTARRVLGFGQHDAIGGCYGAPRRKGCVRAAEGRAEGACAPQQERDGERHLREALHWCSTREACFRRPQASGALGASGASRALGRGGDGMRHADPLPILAIYQGNCTMPLTRPRISISSRWRRGWPSTQPGTRRRCRRAPLRAHGA